MILFLFLMNWGGDGSAQLPTEYLINTRYLDIQDGLSHRIVNSIHQDKQGFIWIGTDNGLDRYDGFKFKNWTKAKDGLSFRRIHHILEDGEGLFWLFTNRDFYHKNELYGIDIFDPNTHEFWSLDERFDQGVPFQVSAITNYFSSPDGRILFVTPQQLWEYRSGIGFTQLNAPKNFIPNTYGEDLKLYGTLGDSLVAFDQEMKLKVLLDEGFRNRNMTWMNEENIITYYPFVYASDSSKLMINSTLSNKESKVIESSFHRKLITQIGYHPTYQQIWVTESGSVKIFDHSGELLYNSMDNQEKLLERQTRVQFFDAYGDIWLGTSNGLYIINLEKNPFHRFIYEASPPPIGEDYVSCRGIIKADDALYVASRSGKQRLDLNTGTYETLTNNIIRMRGRAGNPFPFAKSRNGHIWTGTEQLIAQRSLTGEEFKGFEAIPNQRIWSIYEDKEQVVWMGYVEIGLHFMDFKVEGNPLVPFRGMGDNKALSKSTILHILENPEGQLVLASDNGLYLIDRIQKTIERYWSGGVGDYYLPAEKFQHTFIDADGIYWLATDGSGLIRWDKKSQGEGRTFTQKDGLSNNNIYAVYPDDAGYLWMSSDFGIMRFDKKTFEVRKYSVKDGITHYEFNRISHFQDEEGKIYFGSLNGVTAFDPKILNQITDKEDQNEIKLTYAGVRPWGSPSLNDITEELKQHSFWSFKHDERNMVFRFRSKNYFSSDRLRFFYQIEGINKDWIALNGNELRIHELGIGQYQLKVKTQNTDGTFSSQPFQLSFDVEKPFIYSIWFIIMASVSILFLIWIALEWKVSRLRKRKLELEELVSSRTEKIRQQAAQVREDKQTIELQAKELKELDKAKSRFFANISHELRTPLSLILGPLNRVLRRGNVDEEDHRNLNLMHQHGQQLIRRIDELLDLSRMESDRLELHEQPVMLYHLLKEQISSFIPFALQKNIQMNFEFKADLELCVKVDEDKLKKIQSNFISNALKYIEDGDVVEITLSDLGHLLRLDVKDNGPGIHVEDLPYIFDRFYQARNANKKVLGGTGIGLSLSKELAKVMGGWIEVESQWEEGSCFSLFFNKVEVISAKFEEERVPNTKHIILDQNGRSQVNRKKGTILLVEDHRDLRDFLAAELSDYELIMAGDGVEALEQMKIKQQPMAGVSDQRIPEEPQATALPDLIISDIMMPRMDGFELLGMLKSSREWQHIPVIMLTARTGEADKLQALRIGVDDYMVKPFDPQELRARVDKLLERVERRSEPVKGETAALPPPVNNADTQQWLQKVEKLVLQQLSQSDFTLDRLAADLYISKRQLQRKLKASTGMTANHYIREIRLHQARQLIENEEVETLSELSYAVGFTDPHYFSTLYQKRFGKKPIDAIR